MHLLTPDEHKQIANHLRVGGLAHVVEAANNYAADFASVTVDIELLRGNPSLVDDFLGYASFHALTVLFDDSDRTTRLARALGDTSEPHGDA